MVRNAWRRLNGLVGRADVHVDASCQTGLTSGRPERSPACSMFTSQHVRGRRPLSSGTGTALDRFSPPHDRTPSRAGSEGGAVTPAPRGGSGRMPTCSVDTLLGPVLPVQQPCIRTHGPLSRPPAPGVRHVSQVRAWTAAQIEGRPCRSPRVEDLRARCGATVRSLQASRCSIGPRRPTSPRAATTSVAVRDSDDPRATGEAVVPAALRAGQAEGDGDHCYELSEAAMAPPTTGMVPARPKPTQMLRRIACSGVGRWPVGPTTTSFMSLLPNVGRLRRRGAAWRAT